jgi:hypothetical protein
MLTGQRETRFGRIAANLLLIACVTIVAGLLFSPG